MRTGVRLATLALAVSSLAVPRLAAGQTRLGLRDAVDLALRTRPLLKAGADQVAAAKGLMDQAGRLPNPELQFSNENLRPGQTYSRDVDTLAYVTLPLDVLGKRGRRIDAADHGVTRAEAELEVARRQLIQRVKLAYWAARGAQQRRDLLQTSVTTFQQVIDYHAAQLRVGAIAEQDVLRVRLEGDRIQIAARLAAIEMTRTRIQLLQEIGQTNIPDLVLTEPLDLMPASARTPTIDEVLSARAEIDLATASVQEARANERLQAALARPDLSVIFGYKRTQLPDALSGVNTSLAGVRMTVPILDRNQGNRAAAAAEVLRQEHLLAETQTAVRSDWQKALDDYTVRRSEVVETLEPLRDHAIAIAQIAQAAYQQAGVDLLRLLDAERSRLDAESAWVDGMVAFQQSVVNLEAAQGATR